MSHCEKIRTDVVICDEIFYFNDLEIDVPLGFDAPADSTLAGTVSVTLAECKVTIDEGGSFVLETLFIVQKELTLTTPTGEEFPLEFMERLVFDATFRKCNAAVLDLLGLSPEQLSCHVVYTNAFDEITLDTDADTFTEDLTIELKAMVIAEEQVFMQLCPPQNSVDIPVNLVE